MPTLTINGKEVEVPDGLNLIQAAEEAGVSVPYFCYHPGLSTPANCRMCLVEVEGGRKLEPACYTPARDGMVVLTESEKVKVARQAVLEFILVNHPIDCPICDQAGECWLQDHYLDHDAKPSRVRVEKVAKTKVHPIGPEVVYDGERCIMCTRCVRFCDEIAKSAELAVVERGDGSEIRTFPGRKLDNAYSMCVADICPVGALTSRPYRFKRRAWALKSSPTICTGCARNCSVYLDHFQGVPERYVPRDNLEVNEYWMCDAGRGTVNELKEGRLTEIKVNGNTYERLAEALARTAKAMAGDGENARSWAMVLSPSCSTESLAAAIKFSELCLGGARLFGGGKPDGDGDDFLIHPDKNANNTGLDHVTGDVAVEEIGGLVDAIEKGEVNALYMMGADIPITSDDELFEWFGNAVKRLDLFVIQSPWLGPYADDAHILLPTATHAEQKGTYFNCDGIVQTVPAAVHPAGQALPAWEVFLRLSRALQTPLPFEDWAGAAELAGLEADQINEPVVAPGERPTSPHGPHRKIPGRDATPEHDSVRTWWHQTTRGTTPKVG